MPGQAGGRIGWDKVGWDGMNEMESHRVQVSVLVSEGCAPCREGP